MKIILLLWNYFRFCSVTKSLHFWNLIFISDPFWTHFGPIWTHFGPILDPCWTHFGALLDQFWTLLAYPCKESLQQLNCWVLNYFRKMLFHDFRRLAKFRECWVCWEYIVCFQIFSKTFYITNILESHSRIFP